MAGRTEAATQEHMRRAAVRGAADPRQLAKATRIVRVALTHHIITLDDILDRPRGAA